MTQYLPNPLNPRPSLPQSAIPCFGAEGVAAARTLLPLRPGGERATPLRALPELARTLGLYSLHVKDEGQRLGLGSFKALGGAHAVMTLVLRAAEEALGRKVAPKEVSSAAVQRIAERITFICATDGNHGRSVAQGARLVGARSVILVHEGVSPARAEAIAAQGAEVRRCPGTYDDSVAEAARLAKAEGWTLVSDTAWPGYEEIPSLVMQGYSALAAEMAEALPEVPSHLFLQAGVGGFAAAIGASLTLQWGERAPKLIVVEPDRAACLLQSARAGRPVKAAHGAPTVMAMLECYEPSLTAFTLLGALAEGYMAIPDEAAVAAMRRLAFPETGDPAIIAGESGAAGLAGLMAACADPALREALGLGPEARVALVVTEGATDPESFARLVGVCPERLVGEGERDAAR